MSSTPRKKETPAEFRERMRSIGYMKGGRTRDKVREYRDKKDGHRIKATTDELGNTVTQHATKDDRQDVLIRPQAVQVDLSMMK